MFVFALIFGLCAAAATATVEHAPLEIYDHYSNNSLVYEQFNNFYAQKGYVTFDNFDYGYAPYGPTFPVLFVYKPQGLNELYGYYFPKGFESFSTYGGAEYDPVRQYFYSAPFEAYTPFAARSAYPEFYQYKLTKFVHKTEFLPTFNIVYLAPRKVPTKEYPVIYAAIPK